MVVQGQLFKSCSLRVTVKHHFVDSLVMLPNVISVRHRIGRSYIGVYSGLDKEGRRETGRKGTRLCQTSQKPASKRTSKDTSYELRRTQFFGR